MTNLTDVIEEYLTTEGYNCYVGTRGDRRWKTIVIFHPDMGMAFAAIEISATRVCLIDLAHDVFTAKRNQETRQQFNGYGAPWLIADPMRCMPDWYDIKKGADIPNSTITAISELGGRHGATSPIHYNFNLDEPDSLQKLKESVDSLAHDYWHSSR